MDLCFELAVQIMSRLDGSVGGGRGTRVPLLRRSRSHRLRRWHREPDRPGRDRRDHRRRRGRRFAGGSYVIVQKYVHDLPSWNRLPTEEQERIIGRTKLSDIELAEDVKPRTRTARSPSSRRTARRSTSSPQHAVRRCERRLRHVLHRLCPLAAGLEQMLQNMFVGRPPGNYDRLLDFTHPVTGRSSSSRRPRFSRRRPRSRNWRVGSRGIYGQPYALGEPSARSCGHEQSNPIHRSPHPAPDARARDDRVAADARASRPAPASARPARSARPPQRDAASRSLTHGLPCGIARTAARGCAVRLRAHSREVVRHCC